MSRVLRQITGFTDNICLAVPNLLYNYPAPAAKAAFSTQTNDPP